MRLSNLQKYILKTTYINGPLVSRSVFLKFYPRTTSGAGHSSKPGEDEVKIITKSIERLIAKGLLIGYGHKTAEKLFIDKVSLTPRARKLAKQIARDQQRLPLKMKRK